MKCCILIITYNRPFYLRISLPNIIRNSSEGTKFVIWNNSSDSDTKKILEDYSSNKDVIEIKHADNNAGLNVPTNWFWENFSDFDYLGKVDDDCLVPRLWDRQIISYHEAIENSAILATWIYPKNDFNYQIAKKKIDDSTPSFHILRSCWVGGSGYILKNSVLQEFGLLKSKENFTSYCLRVALKDRIIGWPFPLILMDHMDDPRSPHTIFKSEEIFQQHKPLSAIKFNINSLSQWSERMNNSAQRLQRYSINPKDFIGMKAKIKRNFYKMVKREYFPKA